MRRTPPIEGARIAAPGLRATERGHLVVAECDLAGCGGGRSEGSSVNGFTFLRVLGQGGFGKVLLAECKSKGRRHDEGLCAVKVLKKENVIRDNCVDFVMAERDILNLVYGHPFIINLFSSFQTEVIFQISKSVS